MKLRRYLIEAGVKLLFSLVALLIAAPITTARAGDTQNAISVASAEDLLDRGNQATDANDWPGDAALCSLPYLSGSNVLQTEQELEEGARDQNKTITSSSCRILSVLDKTTLLAYLPDVEKKFATDADLIVRVAEKDKSRDGKGIRYIWAGFIRKINGELRITGAIDDPIETIVDAGDAKRFAGDQAGAIDIYNAAIRIAPDYADAYNMRGFSHEDELDYASARVDFAKAVELSPKDSIFRNNLAEALEKLNQDGAAIEQFGEAIRLDPQNISAFMDRGKLRDKQGDFKNAVADFTKAAKIPPPYRTNYKIDDWYVSERALIYKWMGDTKMKMKDYAGAAAAYSNAIDESPKFPQAFEGRAQARAGLDDAAGADQDKAKAEQIREDPDKAPSLLGKDMRIPGN
jgi:tetratricopeptide (TPR) repeat protein